MILRKILIIILLLPSALLAEKNTEWYYKIYLENSIEMTTAFIKYDDSLKNQVQEFLNRKEVNVITKNDQYAAITLPVSLIKAQINMWEENVEICGLRDDNTYLQEKRIDKLLLDWKSEDKGMLKGFCHVNSIYIVSIFLTHPENKRQYIVDSYLTDNKGEFSSWLLEGKYRISVEIVKRYMASEKYRKELPKYDVKEPKAVQFEAKFEPEYGILEIEEFNNKYTAEQKGILVFMDIDNRPNSLVFTVKNRYSLPIEIIEDHVTLFNTPMYDLGGGAVYKTLSEIKPYKEKGFYPYLYSFSQTIPYADYVKTFVKPDEKIEISGEIKLTNHEIESFELSFLSAKHHLTYIKTDSLGHFSSEVYSDIYAITIVSIPNLKMNVQDILINSNIQNDRILEFTVVDSLPPEWDLCLLQRYSYSSKIFKDLYRPKH